MKIYNTPVTIYHKALEENSFRPLIESKTGHVKRIIKANAKYILDKMSCQLIDEFGVNSDIEQIYWKRNTINRCKIKQILNDENHETLIQILEGEIGLIQKRLLEHSVKDIRKHHARLARLVEERYHRNAKNLTVFEFYNDLNDLKEETEQKKDQHTSKLRKVVNG